jgi:predicted transport protein
MYENNSIQYKKCYVAFIDILGFKDYVKHNSCEKVYVVLSYLEVEAVASPHGIKSKYGIDVQDIKILCISDSVIISIEENIPYALEAIIWLCAAFQLALLLNARLLMRGGISCGDFYIDSSDRTGNPVLFGQAYNNAVELEKYGKRPVIIVDENINIDNLASFSFLSRDDECGQTFVNYMYRAKEVGAFDIKMRYVAKEIKNKIQQFDGNASIKEKYTWTKDYIINSMNDEKIFSEENISRCKIDRQPLNLKVVFVSEEKENDQTKNANAQLNSAKHR